MIALVTGAGIIALGWIASLWIADRSVTARIAQGRGLYARHCASCHGARLEGQADWQKPLPNGRMPAPPHDGSGHTWHHSDDELFLITKMGMTALVRGYESDMPAFERTLTDEEIRAILAFIKSTWPEAERRYQAARSQGR